MVQRNLDIFTSFVKKYNNEYEENIANFAEFVSVLAEEMMKVVMIRFKLDMETFQEDQILLKKFTKEMFNFEKTIKLFILNSFPGNNFKMSLFS